MASRLLTDKVIVITGGSAGIGAATAVECARAGMKVALGARRADRLDAVAQRIRGAGGQVASAVCDVRRDQDVQQLIELAQKTFGRVDAVYANAGYGLFASVLDTTESQSRDIFETNYFGTLRCIRWGVPALRQHPDGLRHLLICSSAASEIGLPMYGAYSATKAAQDSIAGALRAELAGEGIAVTSIHPIGTRSEFFDVVRQTAGGTIPFNTPDFFMQTPEHVARRIVRCLRRPRAEVWPSTSARFGLALMTAFPALAAWMMRRAVR